ncbi:MAG: Glu/Leu/Phe/Val dehydrogenase dimerization domain-containing protein [Pseudomonadota bacterium]
MKIDRLPCPTHETVLRCQDPASGLDAFIAVHDTTLGPGLGGCRMWHYESSDAALADVLRLSAGMTAKSALAGVPFGGGKAVIVGDPKTEKTPEKLRAFGRFVEHLQGGFITGEDVGMCPADMVIMSEETAFVVGRPDGRYASGDPSPVTAEGVVRCMAVAAHQTFGGDGLQGRRIAVQGLGHVGLPLVERLRAAGAEVIAADIDPAACARAAALGDRIVPTAHILDVDADIFAPCALGGVVNDETLLRLTARIVCGSANTQLARTDHATALAARGILYCPDYVVNAGGLISVAGEALRIEDAGWVGEKLDAAVATFGQLLTRARREKRTPLDIADRMVSEILGAARNRRLARAN